MIEKPRRFSLIVSLIDLVFLIARLVLVYTVISLGPANVRGHFYTDSGFYHSLAFGSILFFLFTPFVIWSYFMPKDVCRIQEGKFALFSMGRRKWIPLNPKFIDRVEIRSFLPFLAIFGLDIGWLRIRTNVGTFTYFPVNRLNETAAFFYRFATRFPEEKE